MVRGAPPLFPRNNRYRSPNGKSIACQQRKVIAKKGSVVSHKLIIGICKVRSQDFGNVNSTIKGSDKLTHLNGMNTDMI